MTAWPRSAGAAPPAARALRIAAVAGLAAFVFACGAPADKKGDMPTAEDLNSIPPEQLFEAGKKFDRHGDHLRAAQYLTVALERGYEPKKTTAALISVYVRASRLRDAVEVAEQRLTEDPYDWRLRLLLATLYINIREVERAYAEGLKVVERAPTSAEAHYLLGVIERDEHHADAPARAHFAKYLELAPTGPHASEAREFVESPPPPAAPPPTVPAPTDAGALSEDGGVPSPTPVGPAPSVRIP